MPEQLCMRWRKRRNAWRPAGEVIDTSRYDVSVIPEAAAKRYVVENHYSRSFPAARLSVGLFRKRPFEKEALCGVAVYSVPAGKHVVRAWSGGDLGDTVELGRLVLDDEVPGNGESFFVAASNRLMRQLLPGIKTVLSFSDPFPRSSVDGVIVKPGHLGVLYQALSARYSGRTKARTLVIAPDGSVVSERALSKLRADDVGAAYTYRQLVDFGAPHIESGESSADYVRRALEDGPFRRVRHPGNLGYLIAVGSNTDRRCARARWPGVALPYEKAA